MRDADIKISRSDKIKNCRAMNGDQKQIYYEVLHRIKTTDEPLRLFITGGGGVGKSFLLKNIRQMLIDYFERQLGASKGEVTVLVMAPTGCAAFLVNGATIHSALRIRPDTGSLAVQNLSSEELNALRCVYKDLKVVILEEVSMVGTNMFNKLINQRLQKIKGNNLPLGGTSLHCFW